MPSRKFAEYILGHPPQAEYVVHYPQQPTVDDGVDAVLHVTLALCYQRPLYLLVHHSENVPPKLRALATAIESYGADDDSREIAAARLLRRIELDREHRRQD